MKGVILSRLPGALVVDITHEVPRHDVVSAAYHLRCVEPYFPAGTIFLCVVDPGVGTGRPILCLERGKRTFIAPGNGLLDLLAAGTPGERWHRLTPPAAAGTISSTFHGRDLFAPAAARLAGGAAIRTIARPIDPVPPRPMFADIAPAGPASVKGSVLHVDRFGNVITNIRTGRRTGGEWSARIAGRTVRGVFHTYEEAPPGKLFLICGSSGLLEISIQRGDAAKVLRAAPGTPLTFRIA
jgi:S-adenosylmethionine hydrolase